MPLGRLDPETGREINHLVFANWTIEEVEAYLDYHDRLDRIAKGTRRETWWVLLGRGVR